ncbi:GNAT family N-acetyltransferase [Paenibacillus tarimensis]|uniref:GNAT family N-acetyltransferase n=1 Tax=Paenibacillus tarimensis TaxID=416012 RepID=UPI0022865889
MKVEVKRITLPEDLEHAYRIRRKVFVEEQGVAAEVEIDEYESQADHILVYYEGEPVGTSRIRNVDGVAKLERICLLPTHRKHGLGKLLVSELEAIAREKGLKKAKLHGQVQAKAFYEKLGYTAVSDVFIEENIPHLLFVKEL